MKAFFAILSLILFCLLGSNLVYGQSQDDVNLQKYWYYRWRLVNDFLKVGEGVGHSIPIQSRQGYNGIPDIEIADATIYHGFYLGILATEFKLLRINQRHADLERTKTELYYAIKAFERLDMYGEEYLGMPGKIDGCFQRDDIPCDFLDPNKNPENYRHFNQNHHVPEGFAPVFKVFTSDDCPEGRTLQDKSVPRHTPSMSQDQVIWLLMGFMLIEKCVDGLHHVRLQNGEVIEYDFNLQARRHATNMINYCKYKFPNKPDKARWRLFRPDGKKIFPGQNVFMFKYPLSVIGERMYTEEAENNQKFDKTPGRAQWKLTRIWIPYKNVNGQMITVVGALSGRWGKDELRTMKAIEKTWKKRNWGNFYLPLMAVLHDIDLNEIDIHQRIIADLNLAPAVGPYNLTRDEIARFADSLGIKTYPEGWTRHLKYSSSFENQWDGSLDNYMRRGFYSGLDYMLLFNLYYLTANKPLPTYQNLIHRNFTQRDLNSSSNSREIGAFSTLTLLDISLLDSIRYLRVGEDYVLPRTNFAKDQRPTEIDVLPFNPWEKANVESNSYGWAEVFNVRNHFQLMLKMDEVKLKPKK
jgi:hypothetical protein